jgi:hypothetical protein
LLVLKSSWDSDDSELEEDELEEDELEEDDELDDEEDEELLLLLLGFCSFFDFLLS